METDLIILILITVSAFGFIYIRALDKASKEIWHGSGDPLSMSQMLLVSLHASGQVLFGIFALSILFLLIKNNLVSSEAGLPILSALAAYLLGRGFRESIFLSKNKEDNKKENQRIDNTK